MRISDLKTWTAPLLGVVLALLGGMQQANAATLTYSNTVAATTDPASVTLSQFNTALGTLTGVTITIDYSTLAGSFAVTNYTTGAVTVNRANATFTLAGSSANLGFTTVNSSITGISTTPAWASQTIDAMGSQIYTVGGGQNFVTNASSAIAGSYWSAYEGLGDISFTATELPSITTTGKNYGVDSTDLSAQTKVTVTYTYTVAEGVPEPATWAMILGGVGTLAFVQRMRRRNR